MKQSMREAMDALLARYRLMRPLLRACEKDGRRKSSSGRRSHWQLAPCRLGCHPVQHVHAGAPLTLRKPCVTTNATQTLTSACIDTRLHA